MKRGSWIRSLIFFIVDNYIEFFALASIVCAVVFLNVIGLILIIPITLIAWLLFNVIEIRETLLQIEENTRGGLIIDEPTITESPKPNKKPKGSFTERLNKVGLLGIIMGNEE